jgi:hypothetical protein
VTKDLTDTLFEYISRAFPKVMEGAQASEGLHGKPASTLEEELG